MNREQRAALTIIVLLGRAGIPVTAEQQSFYDEMKSRYPREHEELVELETQAAAAIQMKLSSGGRLHP